MREETVRDKCRICFLMLLSIVFIGWIGGWTRALKSGNEAYTSGDYHAAQIAFREATLQKPDSPLTHYNLGTALYRSGQFNKAIEAFRESLSKHTEKAEATLRLAHIYYNLGNAEFKNGDLGRAIDAYTHSLRLNPGDTDAQHNRALALQLAEQQADLVQQQRANRDTEPPMEPNDIGEAEAAQLLEHLKKNENTRRQKLLQQQRKSGYRRSKDW